MRGSSVRSGLAAVAALAAVGCGASNHTTATDRAAIVSPTGAPIGRLSTPGTPKGEQTVRIQVVATSAHANRQALALVPVYINGRGPLPFAVDTGASRSLISAQLARSLHLKVTGSLSMLQGVGGPARAEDVQVRDWRAGGVALPPSTIAAMLASSAVPQSPPAPGGHVVGPVGLLGSDVLSRYGKIAIDYDRGLLVLDPPVR